jgi:hypothetical protein
MAVKPAAPRSKLERANTANTSSGRPKQPFDLTSGAKQVGKILGAGEPGKASGFRPGGHGPGYNYVGGKSGMQVKIPDYHDQSNVHQGKGVDPTDILTGGAHGGSAESGD